MYRRGTVGTGHALPIEHGKAVILKRFALAAKSCGHGLGDGDAASSVGAMGNGDHRPSETSQLAAIETGGCPRGMEAGDEEDFRSQIVAETGEAGLIQ